MSEEVNCQNKIASNYLKRYSGNGLLYHNHVISRIMSLLTGTILDVGCGTGFISDCCPDRNITGIDVSQEALNLNKHNCYLGSAEAIPFPNDFFDSVICRCVLHHVENPHVALQEMRRVLKPGGKIVFLETNSSILNNIPRKLLKLTPRFSKDHKNFAYKELDYLIGSHFNIKYVGFVGFIAYVLIGFPDFIKLPIPERIAKWLIQLDERLERSKVRRLAMNVLVEAYK